MYHTDENAVVADLDGGQDCDVADLNHAKSFVDDVDLGNDGHLTIAVMSILTWQQHHLWHEAMVS